MKLIFVCSAYSGDIENNVKRAQEYCKLITDNGDAPYAPHLLCPQWLNEERDRDIGVEIGLSFLEVCNEVHVFVINNNITAGMQKEIEYANNIGVPVVFHTVKLLKNI